MKHASRSEDGGSAKCYLTAPLPPAARAVQCSPRHIQAFRLRPQWDLPFYAESTPRRMCWIIRSDCCAIFPCRALIKI